MQAEIGYYQWVPIVLALQAIMFCMPSWLWATLHKFSGQLIDFLLVLSFKWHNSSLCHLFFSFLFLFHFI